MAIKDLILYRFCNEVQFFFIDSAMNFKVPTVGLLGCPTSISAFQSLIGNGCSLAFLKGLAILVRQQSKIKS